MGTQARHPCGRSVSANTMNSRSICIGRGGFAMSNRSPSRHELLRLIAVIAAATGLLLSALPVDAAWTRFHGNADNTGFVDVVTAPAGKGSRSVPGLGTFAP